MLLYTPTRLDYADGRLRQKLQTSSYLVCGSTEFNSSDEMALTILSKTNDLMAEAVIRIIEHRTGRQVLLGRMYEIIESEFNKKDAQTINRTLSALRRFYVTYAMMQSDSEYAQNIRTKISKAIAIIREELRPIAKAKHEAAQTITA